VRTICPQDGLILTTSTAVAWLSVGFAMAVHGEPKMEQKKDLDGILADLAVLELRRRGYRVTGIE